MANLSNINNKFIVTDGGNILIGSTVERGIVTIDQLGVNTVGLVINSTSATYPPYLYLRDQGGTGYSEIQANNDLYLNCTKVGIGTNSPSYRLDINSSDAGLRIAGTTRSQILLSNSTSAWQIESPTSSGNVPAGALGIIESGVGSRLTILTGGNVGIGETSPDAALHVMGTTGLPATSGTTFTGTMRLQVAGGYGTVMDFGAVGPATGTQWIQVTDASNQAIQYPLLLQPNGGNVGIGNPSPTYQLDVLGSGDYGGIIHIKNTTANAYPRLAIQSNVKGYHIGVGGSGAAAGYANNLYFYDNTAAAIRMVIDTSGNVGIGVVPEGNIVSYIKQLRIGEQTTIQGHADGVGGVSASWFSTNYIFSVGGATAINTGESMVYQAQSGRHSFQNSESTTAGGVVTLRDGFSIEPNLDLKASTKQQGSGGVGAVLTPPYNLRFNAFNGTGPKFLGVYPLRGGSQFLDIAINTTSDNIMYYAMFRGYFYGRGSRWSWTAGYTYQGSIINVQNHFVLSGNAANLTSYRGAAGSAYPANLCLRMDSGSSGYTEGYGELYIFAHANSLQNGFQVAAFSENNAANPGLWT